MSVILTNAGASHLIERAAGSVLTNEFDALVLGQGNDDPSVSDTLAEVTQRLDEIARLATGYPQLADTDPRNGGSGADVYTWRFERPAGTAFVASNFAVTNYSGGAFVASAPLLVHGKQTIAQRHDERLIVWINAKTGDTPTVFTARESALEGRVQRVVGFAARNRGLSAHPNGVAVDSSEVHTRPAVGQHVWTAADVVGRYGGALDPATIDAFTLTVERLDASTGTWKLLESAEIDCYRHVFTAHELGDQRWNAQGGYNVAHEWQQPIGLGEATYRLRYAMTLCDDDVRRWTNVVEVRDGR